MKPPEGYQAATGLGGEDATGASLFSFGPDAGMTQSVFLVGFPRPKKGALIKETQLGYVAVLDWAWFRASCLALFDNFDLGIIEYDPLGSGTCVCLLALPFCHLMHFVSCLYKVERAGLKTTLLHRGASLS